MDRPSKLDRLIAEKVMGWREVTLLEDYGKEWTKEHEKERFDNYKAEYYQGTSFEDYWKQECEDYYENPEHNVWVDENNKKQDCVRQWDPEEHITFDPSWNLDDAMKVIEKLGTEGADVFIRQERKFDTFEPYNWEVDFVYTKHEDDRAGAADESLTRAICLAALRYKGIEYAGD